MVDANVRSRAKKPPNKPDGGDRGVMVCGLQLRPCRLTRLRLENVRANLEIGRSLYM